MKFHPLLLTDWDQTTVNVCFGQLALTPPSHPKRGNLYTRLPRRFAPRDDKGRAGWVFVDNYNL